MTVSFGGKSTRIPSVMTKVDTTGLIRGGITASGVIGIIGMANSGPAFEVGTYLVPSDAKDVYNSGPLMESANESWTHGAQTIKLIRVGHNVAPATLTLTASTTASTAVNALTLTSIESGDIYNSVQIKVETFGTSGQKKLTLNYYDEQNNETYNETFYATTVTEMASAINTAASLGGSPSKIITATVVSSAGTLDNLSYTNMSGGDSGMTGLTNAEISSALELFESEDVNIILFDHTINDLAAQALLLGHCKVMSNNGKERICLMGHDIGALIGDPDTLNSIIAKAVAMNSSRSCVVTPGTDGKSSGFTAAKLSGLIVSFDPAEPMTHKTLQISTLETKYSRVVLELFVQYGVLAIEEAVNGRRVVRGITTAQDQSSVSEDPFKELSVIRAIDSVVVTVRQNLDVQFIGKKGLNGTISAIKSSISTILGNFVSNQIINNFKNISVTKNALRPDMFDVTMDIQPVFPINFITVTFSLQNS
jgi:hypothetical protein